jgi:putative lipoic acid-binding regulatory protein|tara:strand:- start:586 stop:870 length:285 start_codon:yes stop_codon:yes gene_type:complete
VDKKSSEFYDRLKTQLEQDSTWPSPYLFKFIVPSKLDKIAEIEAAFDDTDAKINTRDSSKGTYTSISIKVTMESADSIIAKYLEVSSVEGVISL